MSFLESLLPQCCKHQPNGTHPNQRGLQVSNFKAPQIDDPHHEETPFHDTEYLVDILGRRPDLEYDEGEIVDRMAFRAKYFRTMFKTLEDSEQTGAVATDYAKMRQISEGGEQLMKRILEGGAQPELLKAAKVYKVFMKEVRAMVNREQDKISNNGNKREKRSWFGVKGEEREDRQGFAGMQRLLLSHLLLTKEECLRHAHHHVFHVLNLNSRLDLTQYTPVGLDSLPTQPPGAAARQEDVDGPKEVETDRFALHEVAHCRKFDQGLAILKMGLLQDNGAKVLNFLKALTFEVRDDDWLRGRLLHGFRQYISVIPGDFTCSQSDEYTYNTDEPTKQHPIYDKENGLGLKKHMVQEHMLPMKCWKAPQKEYRVFWCGVKGLFYNMPFLHGEDHMHVRMMEFMLALEEVPTEALAAPVAQVFLRYHWEAVRYDYIFDRILDGLILFLFCYVAADVHTGEWVPRPRLYMWLVLMHAIVLIGRVIMVCSTAMMIYGGKRACRAIINGYNVIFGVFDTYTLCVLLDCYYHDIDIVAKNSDNVTMASFGEPFEDRSNVTAHIGFGNTWPGLHPTFLFSCIAARWVYFMMQLINVSWIGRAVLPVFESMRSPDTLVLLGYMLVCTVGVLQTYFCFPVGTDDSDLGEAWTRVMRLFWMGDFDLFELEGVDGTVTGNVNWVNSTQWSADLTEDDGDHTRWMWGTRIFAFGCLAIGPILFLNTLIAVLGNAYEDCKKEINSRFVKYRLNALKILFLRRLCIDRMFRYGIFGRCFTNVEHSEKGGVWMRVPSDVFASDEDGDDTATISKLQETEKNLREELQETNKKIAKMEELLQTAVAALPQ